jgi:D-alanyl-D-alanine carboxypeptidase
MYLGVKFSWRYVMMAGVSAGLGIAAVSQAEARAAARHGPAHAATHETKHAARGPIHGSNYKPDYAEFVIDDNTGQALLELNADDPRHPASVTKIMTLYLLFEQLEAGKLKLDSQIPVSAHAAAQPPTKLGIKPNQTLSVEDAIGGLVTRSANDAAAAVAEAIGGTEEDFAKLMTLKANALGMTHTIYVNASGLPADEQITTARDQAILGRAIHDRFPGYYKYFSVLYFRYHGKDIHNHNGLLGNVEGMDGIKTGYTEASGYNLVASVRRNGKHIIAVVLGGKSNGARDTRMRQIIEDQIKYASATRTAPPTLELAVAPTAPAAPAATDPATAAAPDATPASTVAAQPVAVEPPKAPDPATAPGPAPSANMTFVGQPRNFTLASHDRKAVTDEQPKSRGQGGSHPQVAAVRNSRKHQR